MNSLQKVEELEEYSEEESCCCAASATAALWFFIGGPICLQLQSWILFISGFALIFLLHKISNFVKISRRNSLIRQKIRQKKLEPVKDQFYLEAEKEVELMCNPDFEEEKYQWKCVDGEKILEKGKLLELEKQQEKKDEEILEEIYNSEKKMINEFLEEINGNKVISFDVKSDVKYGDDVDWYEFRTTTKSVRYALGHWYRVSRDYGRAGTEFKSNSELIKLSAKGNKYFHENVTSKTEDILKQARKSKYNYDALRIYKSEQNETATTN